MDDQRTTVMIKNIPNKYTRKLLINELDVSFQKKYDFIYLPIDFVNKCNYGYAFVNFISPKYVFDIYEQWSGNIWPHFNSSKVCQITYARVQGLEKLQNHFRTSNIMKIKYSEYKPVFGS